MQKNSSYDGPSTATGCQQYCGAAMSKDADSKAVTAA